MKLHESFNTRHMLKFACLGSLSLLIVFTGSCRATTKSSRICMPICYFFWLCPQLNLLVFASAAFISLKSGTQQLTCLWPRTGFESRSTPQIAKAIDKSNNRNNCFCWGGFLWGFFKVLMVIRLINYNQEESTICYLYILCLTQSSHA